MLRGKRYQRKVCAKKFPFQRCNQCWLWEASPYILQVIYYVLCNSNSHINTFMNLFAKAERMTFAKMNHAVDSSVLHAPCCQWFHSEWIRTGCYRHAYGSRTHTRILELERVPYELDVLEEAHSVSDDEDCIFRCKRLPENSRKLHPPKMNINFQRWEQARVAKLRIYTAPLRVIKMSLRFGISTPWNNFQRASSFAYI